MKFVRLGAALALTVALGACQNMGQKEIIGTAAGAGVGGLIGSQFGHGSGQLAATAAGVFIGGLIGNQIGAYMDEADSSGRARLSMPRSSARRTASIRWQNPNNGHYGYSVPERTYQNQTASTAANIRRPSSSITARRAATARPAASPTALGVS
jgi:surface antigen